MEYTCPVCQASSDITESDLKHPVTRTTCRSCGTILLINPDTGKVDAHKSPLKDSSALETLRSQPTDESASVLSKRSKDKESTDWTAVVVVVIILIVLISAGVYFAFNLDIV
ncbi:MAG: hypothetical protein PVI71_11935 [Desulfobacterales bacterium]